jgi:hypothetical protein
VLELSRDGAKAKVQETIAIFDRWYDSDDWKPWSSPSNEDEVRPQADPDAMRPEIAENEHKHRLIKIATTAHPRASVLSGRDTLDPTQIEMSAVAIFDFCRSTTSDKAHNSNDHYGSIGELLPVLTMAAARVDPKQHAYGTPCMPKPKRW